VSTERNRTRFSSILESLRAALSLIRHGHAGEVIRELRRRLYSTRRSYCLLRDLSVEFPSPQAKIAIAVRRLEEEDVPAILDVSRRQTGSDRSARMRRLRLIEYGIPTCYVAVTSDGTPCYLQWLMGHEQNERIRTFFGGEYPRLDRNEMLLENAFTAESFRGMRIMPCAMSRIAEKANQSHADRVITFVDEANIPSLKGCERAGFVPYLLRTERSRFFRRSFEIERLPEGTAYPFD